MHIKIYIPLLDGQIKKRNFKKPVNSHQSNAVVVNSHDAKENQQKSLSV